jgi:hypothetical protein
VENANAHETPVSANEQAPVRHANGRWAKGKPGGPGRPRRDVERQYLAALSSAVPVEVWREIVDSAVAAAKNGNAAARAWLARYVLGNQPLTLVDLAALEADEGLTDEG